MKAYDATLEELFWRRMCFVIPAFQRPYVWKEEKQWQPLWDDILDMAERYLNRPHHMPAHFLGAIVTQQQQSRGIDVDPRRVIDGQQRLTTLSLLLGAMHEVFGNFDLPHAQEVSKFVMNDMPNIDQYPDLVFKVWPTVLDDQNAFRRAMLNGLPTDEEKSNQIIKAYEFFKRRVTDWIGDDSETHVQRAEVLQEIVTKSLKLVMIEIDMNDNPHIIFERMNARGEALLQAELVKNFILDTEEKQEHHKIAAKHLKKLDEKWWREEGKQRGQGDRPRVEIFLNYWMFMRQMDEVRPDKVFPIFCEYAKGKSITAIAEDIGRLADIYRKIQETNDNSVLGRFLYRWNTIGLGVPLTPVLMWILSSDLPEENLERCLRIIESYLVRRMVCTSSTKNYSRMALELLHRLDSNLGSGESTVMADEVLREFLVRRKEDYGTFWPTDIDLRESFLSRKFYRRGFPQSRLRIVLEGIEEGLRKSPNTDDKNVPRNLTIEHIMPRKWENHWDPPTATDIPGEAEDRRNWSIDTIGNLTLLTQPLNGKLSNASWKKKRDGSDGMDGLRKSTLQINNDLVNSGDIWNEETITARARRLAEVAAKVWPHADRI